MTAASVESAQDRYRAVARLLLVVVGIDVVLVLVNFADPPSFLNLDEEKNFPTWYSSAKLLATAFAAIGCRVLEPDSLRRGARGLVWPAVAVIFVGLSMDETSTAHERLAAWIMSGDRIDSLRTRLLGGDAAKDAFLWPVLFAPVIVAVAYFLVTALYSRMKHDRPNLLLGLAGCAAFLAAVALEGPAVYMSPPIDAWGDAEIARYSFFVRLEESAEIFGATMMLASLLLHARQLAGKRC